MRSLFITLGLFVLLQIISPQLVQASTNAEGFTLDPIFQEVTLEASAEATAIISISNDTAEPQEVAVFATDITQEPLTGKLLFTDGFQGNYPYSLAPYVRFDKDRFVIPPQETELLEVTIENRDTLKPGGHYAAVVVEPQIGIISDKTTILPGLTSVFFVRKLSGLFTEYKLDSLSGLAKIMLAAPKKAVITLYNSGNSHLIPRGTIVITGWNSRLLLQQVFNPSSAVIFPDTTREMTTQLQFQKQPLLLEPLRLTFTYRADSEIEYQQTSISGVYVHPVLLISILMGSATSYWYWRKQQTHAKK